MTGKWKKALHTALCGSAQGFFHLPVRERRGIMKAEMVRFSGRKVDDGNGTLYNGDQDQ